MQHDKPDFYTAVHKGLRKALFDLTLDAARLSFEHQSSAVALLTSVSEVLSLLDAHAQHEDRHLLPLVKRVAPELAAELMTAHAALDSRTWIVRHAFERTVLAETRAEREAWAQAAHVELSAFVGHQLVHLAFEEQCVMEALCARVDWEELQATHGALVGEIAPSEMLRFAAVMLPALSVAERSGMLSKLSEPRAQG